MEPIEFSKAARKTPPERVGFKLDGQKIPLALYLHVNPFNDFEYETLGLILNVDHTLEDIQVAIGKIEKQISLLVVAPKPQRVEGDMVTRPPHYDRLKIEPTFYNEENKVLWLQGNANKYIARHRFKWDPVEDLRKAQRNLAMYVRKMQGDPDWSL